MKKMYLFLSLFLLFSVFFTGCSNISTEEYENLEAQYLSLKQEYTTLNDEYDSLSAELTSIKNQETAPAHTTNYIFSDNYPSAAVWVKSSFGDNAFYSEVGNISNKSSEKYFQVIVPSNYDPSDANDAVNIVKSSLTTLELTGLEYDEISIKFIYEDQGTFMDFSFTKSEDTGSYSLHTISGDFNNYDTILNSYDSSK